MSVAEAFVSMFNHSGEDLTDEDLTREEDLTEVTQLQQLSDSSPTPTHPTMPAAPRPWDSQNSTRRELFPDSEGIWVSPSEERSTKVPFPIPRR